MKIANKVGHFDSGNSHLSTYIPGLGAATLNGLLDSLGRQHPEENRDPGFQANMGRTFGHLIDYHVEVRGGATDDHTETDHRVILLRPCHLLGNERNLKGPRHPGDIDIRRLGPRTLQRVERPFQKFFRYKGIKSGNNNPEFLSIGLQISFNKIRYSFSPEFK